MKEWQKAEIAELDMSETEADFIEGKVEDGEWTDCTGQWYPGYHS